MPTKQTVADKIASVSLPKTTTECVWGGPKKDGITVSLLSKFLCCRERFRALVVDGFRPREEFVPAIEFGNMWHLCEESVASEKRYFGEYVGTTDMDDSLIKYKEELGNKFKTQRAEIEEWYDKCRVMFPIYLDYWKKPEENCTPLLAEQVFDVLYTLPDARVVRLRGKWDRVDLVTLNGKRGLRLRDNKTKSRIDQDQIQRQLTFDLQMMFYTVAIDEDRRQFDAQGKYLVVEGGKKVLLTKDPIVGFQYNVVKRPSHYQGKKEDRTGFCNRFRDLVKESPGEFFMRWDVPVSHTDIVEFRRRFFDNTLMQLCDWWEWIDTVITVKKKGGKTDWFDNSIHTVHPFGVYNSLDEGGGTHLDRYVMTGDEGGLTRTQDLYPELKESK